MLLGEKNFYFDWHGEISVMNVVEMFVFTSFRGLVVQILRFNDWQVYKRHERDM